MAERKRSIVGRLVVFSMYGAFCLYVALAIIGSVVTDLYGKPPPSQSTGLSLREKTWCIRNLGGLRDELQGQVKHELLHPVREGDPYARWNLWHEGWKEKFRTARGRCEGTGNETLDHGYHTLERMDESYSTAVMQVAQTESEIAPALKNTIQALRLQP